MTSGGDRPAFEPQEESTMAQYLLSHHSVEGEARDPMTDEEMQQFMTRINSLEEEMRVDRNVRLRRRPSWPRHRHGRTCVRR